MESRYIGYKIKLFPTPDQAKRLIQICNTFRYCYNWGLEFCNKAREEGRKHPTWIDMEKEFTTFRHENKWLENYPRTTCTNAFKNVSNAFERFFSKQCRYPKFKSKRKDRMRFHTREDRMRFMGEEYKYLRIEGMNGDLIYCGNHNIPPNKKYWNAYISFDGDDFWLSLSIEMYYPIKFEPKGEPIGIDLGVRRMMTLSDGTMYLPPNVSKLQKRKARLDRSRMRDTKKRLEESIRTRTKFDLLPVSKNQLKREKAYRKCCRKIANKYNTAILNAVNEIAKRNAKFIVLEDIRQRELAKQGHYMAKQVHDMRSYMMRDRITRKCSERGTKIIIASREYPSTQICHNCGSRKKMGSDKIYKCPVCGLVFDRDVNAAINLLNYGKEQMRITLVS